MTTKRGRGAKSPNARRNSPRIAISGQHIAKIDAMCKYHNKSRPDILEELIDKEFEMLEAVGLIE